MKITGAALDAKQLDEKTTNKDHLLSLDLKVKMLYV
jgi:hypothetical protein